MNDDKLDKIEELKNKLFNKNFDVRPRYHTDFTFRQKKEVPDFWTEEKEEKSDFAGKIFLKTSMFKKFFIFSIIFFVLALGYALYSFFAGSNAVSNDNIEITVLGNAFAAGGEELPLQIEIVNKNKSPLQLVDLVVKYPKNASNTSSQDTKTLRTSIGEISAGGIHDENVKLILYGEQGSIQPLTISLEYRVENSNAIFVKDVPYQVTISSTPINLSINAPSEANPNQEISFKVKATLNAANPVSNILVRVDYPIGFEFKSADPKPTFGNHTWTLGDLPPGAEKDISIIGKMVDVADGEQKNFHVFAGSQDTTDKASIGTVFNSMGQLINIKKAFLEANLYVNGIYQREYATDANTTVSGEIRWANNLDTQISNMIITAKLSGNAFNPRSVSAINGFYDSSTNTITWDRNTIRDFAEVQPGASGSVAFTVSPSSLFSDKSGMLAQPAIHIDTSIKGNNQLEGNAVQILDNSESKIIRIISNVGIAAKALYYSGPFENTGPIPPKANESTTYTIVWTLSNTANNISKAQMRATLPPWMNFVGTVSPPAEDLTYNPATKEITWNIGGIPAGTGIAATDREAAFQVTFLPSVSQIGLAPILINDAVLTGHDDFANVDITVNKNSLNTQLLNDTSFPPNGDRVVE